MAGRGSTTCPTTACANVRWGGNLVHNGILDANALGLGGLGINVNLNRVSDDNYWRDFPRATLALTQRLLPNDATLIWARGDYSAVLRTLKWQTIQDVSSPITPSPYDRMPQTHRSIQPQ